ncbi:zinc-ribbon domain-containing protein [Actinoplanes sp. NPDC020271]|uniref:zinc-ribbon domain-containing protein n=1 Tax=Actinoplanes sp. NPDC020271 TaxID=3363896 RepID=UPI0037921D00
MLDKYPALAAEADGWDPSKFKPKSNRKMPWRCAECGHQWLAPLSNRVGGSGCSKCGYKRTAEFHSKPQAGRSLAEMFPELAAQAAGWDPFQYSYGSETKLLWRCSRGHQWTATPNNRTNALTGCPFCAGQRIQAGYNDLTTTHPKLATQADGWDASAVGFGWNAKLPWLCPEGHRWHATVVNRAVRGRGCPSCARSGYDQSQPGFFYIKTVRDSTDGTLLAWKLGVTNDLVQRSATLRYSNRGLVKLGHVLKMHSPDGRRIKDLENAVLTDLRRLGACPGLSKVQMPVGYSETINPEVITLVEVRRLVTGHWASLAKL